MAKKNIEIEKNAPEKISFAIPINTFKGVYSNFALITHTEREFIVDFMFQINKQAELISRIIMNPEQMSDFQKALNRNIETFYSKKNGKK